jgi:hypothetical protein
VQSYFLERLTESEYEHLIFSHSSSIDDSILLNCPNFDPQEQHVFGVSKILEAFRSDRSYTHCLIVDSDAFPVRKSWDKILVSLMRDNSCSTACPIRFENLDTFFHPSVIFIERSAEWIEVSIRDCSNLLGHLFREVVVDPPGKAMPLLKTNVWSPSPVVSTIYSDLFYHHGFGSRDFLCRSVHSHGYYRLDEAHLSGLTDDFFSRPRSFIGRLMGGKIM